MKAFFIVIAVFPLLAACAGSAVGMANPASTYCVEKGGTVDIRQTEAGQLGWCRLPDGAEVEEWTLYRRDHPQS